jgi:hypothetical protein
MQVQQRQHLGDLRRLARPGRQDHRAEPLPLAGFRVESLVVDPGRPDRHRPRRGRDLPRLVIAVTDHQPTPVAVQQIGVRLDVGGDLGLQRRRQHLPRPLAHELVQHRPTTVPSGVVVGQRLVVNYLEHRRTFPNQRANAGPDQNEWASDHPREGAPLHVTSPRAIHRF